MELTTEFLKINSLTGNVLNIFLLKEENIREIRFFVPGQIPNLT